MGQRSGTQTVVAVFAALLKRRLWQQAELARAVGVGTETIHRLLVELRQSGVPLDEVKEHPHVYWRVSRTWHPGGVLFQKEDVAELLRHLRRLPRSKARERLLGIVSEHLRGPAEQPAAPSVVSRDASEHEEQYVAMVEDAAAKRVPLSMRYFTTARGKPSDRHASVHLVEIGPPTRFIATCHRNGDLRRFRVDCILRARLDDAEAFRQPQPGAVDAYRAASVDGFKGDGPPIACSFTVREPDANWVGNNLLEGMRAEGLRDGIRVTAQTSAILRVARFVVSLGAAATPEDATLTRAVVELARGALEQARARVDGLESDGVSASPPPHPGQPRSDV